MTATGYRPETHPVLLRQRAAMGVADARALIVRSPDGQLVSPNAVADQSARIEDLAQRVVMLPDSPLTGQQRRGLHLIARELLRRAEA